MKISLCVLFYSVSLLILGQTPQESAKPKPARMKANVLDVRPPKAPEPAPGEYLEIDRAAGVAWVRALCRDGAFRNWQIPLAGLIEPELRAGWEIRGGSPIRYQYGVLNGARARQDIVVWRLDITDAHAVKFVHAAENWEEPTLTALPGRHSLGWRIRHGGPGAVKAGTAASEFVLESPLLPGLTRACFASSVHLTLPDDFHLASEWAYLEVVNRVTEWVCLPAIAPKLQPDLGRSELMEAIRNEFTQAAAKEEFASIREELEKFSATLAPGRAPATLPKGKTALQREFLAAMELNLEVAQSRPD